MTALWEHTGPENRMAEAPGRVVVGMSGGVDSATGAALLNQHGHEVIGVGLKLTGEGSNGDASACCGLRGLEDARRVAHRIGIPFYVMNCVADFEREVISYFCRTYGRGRTPNPCVACNRRVKFPALLRAAEAVDADFVATGHYARVVRKADNVAVELRRGADRSKDQSYFLHSLSRRQLSRVIFPLAEMTKGRTRRTARSLGLPVWEKPATQDACFLGERDYRHFLREKSPHAFAPGPIVSTRGEVLGRHEGIACFTIGQRKGLGLARREPLYVVGIDASSNRVIAGSREDVGTRRLIVERVNWIAPDAPPPHMRAQVQVRYRHKASPATMTRVDDGRVEVGFDRPQHAPAPGQSAVFYRGEIVLGGGIIA